MVKSHTNCAVTVLVDALFIALTVDIGIFRSKAILL